MIIIIEGPDGSGKSRFAEQLSEAINWPVLHNGGPPKDQEEIIDRVRKRNQLDNTILDRHPIISENVYGPVLRGTWHLPLEQWLYQFPANAILIYCTAERFTQLDQKEHKSAEHIKEVLVREKAIRKAYDDIISNFNAIHYDWRKDSCAELISLIAEKISKK